ncbi:MAG: hypothetical protein J0M04_09695 [Verrucomicrobia bacterium]|nr:hypothetical protein [Verrucomicrobiota bacterium]
MTSIPYILIAWVIHAVVAAVVVSPVVFLTRQRVRWQWWELFAVVIPFGVWAAMMCSDMSTGSKTLSNFVIEPCVLSLALAFGALARVSMSARIPEKTASAAILVGLCLVAAGVFWMIPALGE